MTRRGVRGLILRSALALLAVVVLLGVLAITLPYVMSSQTVRQQVAGQISDMTGRGVTLRGDQALRVFPNLSVELTDVVVEGDVPGIENALIVTETLRGQVRALPLLLGRIELSSFELTRPTIQLHQRANGQSNWALDGSTLYSAMEPGRTAGRGLQLGVFRIVDGTFHFVDAVRGVEETITSADLSLSWPTSSTRAAITGSGIWRGENVELTASLGQPAALARAGSTSGVVLSIASAPLRLRFDGTVSPGGRQGESALPWQASGHLHVSTPSLRRTASWLGADMETGSTFGTFRLDADLNLIGLSADLTDVDFSLDGNEAEGVLTLDVGGPDDPSGLTLQGTLDLNQLDLSAYLDMARPTRTAQAPGDWRFLPVPDVFASGLALDVRVAARQVLAGPVTLGETAGSVLLTADRMVLGIAEANAYGGLARGSLTFDRSGATQRLSLDLATDGVQLAPFLGAFGETTRVDGALTLRSMLYGEGDTVTALVETLRGDLAIDMEGPVLTGIDLDRIAEQLLARSLDLTTIADSGGSTALLSLTGDLYAAEGRLHARAMEMKSRSTSIVMTGQTDIATRALGFGGVATLNGSDATRLLVPFALQGTWSDPSFVPDLLVLDAQMAEN